MNRHLHRAALLSSVLFVVPALAHEVPLQNGEAPRHTELFDGTDAESKGGGSRDRCQVSESCVAPLGLPVADHGRILLKH